MRLRFLFSSPVRLFFLPVCAPLPPVEWWLLSSGSSSRIDIWWPSHDKEQPCRKCLSPEPEKKYFNFGAAIKQTRILASFMVSSFHTQGLIITLLRSLTLMYSKFSKVTLDFPWPFLTSPLRLKGLSGSGSPAEGPATLSTWNNKESHILFSFYR